jgi:hypothetical protein
MSVWQGVLGQGYEIVCITVMRNTFKYPEKRKQNVDEILNGELIVIIVK